MNRKKLLALFGAATLIVSLAACGDDDDSGGGGGAGGGEGEPWILGTTDTVTALDPAGSYDLGSSTLEYNLYQTLVTVPPNSDGDRRRRRRVVRVPRPADLHLHPQGGAEVLQRERPHLLRREVQLRARDHDPGPDRCGDLPARQHHRHRRRRHRHDERGRDRDAGRHHGHLPPRQAGHHVPVRAHLPGCRRDRRRGDVPRRREAERRGDHRLRALQAEPVQGRRPGRAGGQREVHRREHRQGAAGLREVLLRALRAQARRGERRGRRRLAEPEPAGHRRPRGQRRRHGRHRRRLRDPLLGVGRRRRRSASRRRSARPRPRSSTARRSPRTPTTAPSTRCTPSCRRASPGGRTPSRTTYGEPDPAKAKQILDDAGINTPVDAHRRLDAHALRAERRGRGQRGASVSSRRAVSSTSR